MKQKHRAGPPVYPQYEVAQAVASVVISWVAVAAIVGMVLVAIGK